MSKEAVQEIIGTAIIDKHFLHDLLNSKRHQAIARFDLTAEERYVISHLEANSLEQLALQLDNWLTFREQEKISIPRYIPAEKTATVLV